MSAVFFWEEDTAIIYERDWRPFWRLCYKNELPRLDFTLFFFDQRWSFLYNYSRYSYIKYKSLKQYILYWVYLKFIFYLLYTLWCWFIVYRFCENSFLLYEINLVLLSCWFITVLTRLRVKHYRFSKTLYCVEYIFLLSIWKFRKLTFNII